MRRVRLKIDFEETLLSLRISGKERKTSKRASVTLNVTCELRCREPLYSVGVGLKSPQSRLKTKSAVLERLIDNIILLEAPRLHDSG